MRCRRRSNKFMTFLTGHAGWRDQRDCVVLFGPAPTSLEPGTCLTQNRTLHWHRKIEYKKDTDSISGKWHGKAQGGGGAQGVMCQGIVGGSENLTLFLEEQDDKNTTVLFNVGIGWIIIPEWAFCRRAGLRRNR